MTQFDFSKMEDKDWEAFAVSFLEAYGLEFGVGRAFGKEAFEKSVIIPCGTDLKHRTRMRSSRNAPLVAAFLGAFHHAKGAETLLDIAPRIKRDRVRFRVIGPASPEMRIRGMAHDIEMTGAYRIGQLPVGCIFLRYWNPLGGHYPSMAWYLERPERRYKTAVFSCVLRPEDTSLR